ncbi:MAG: hypothetical protein KJ597_00225 [Nanoarchaeota archaeon]|nr:hypothetical protein [Nanoarchaeota archaeon]MBU1621979.1 hypothetical protein [Nanoarchaeota archaeon]
MGLKLTHGIDEGVRITQKNSGIEHFVRVLSISPDQENVFLKVVVGGFPKHVILKRDRSAEVLSKFKIRYHEPRGRQQANLNYDAPPNYFIERGDFYEGQFTSHLRSLPLEKRL